MKTISIRELHEKTGHWVRRAAATGEIVVTDRGQTIARIVPQPPQNEIPYFARRKMSPEFKRLWDSGKLRGGTDSTQIISEDREDRYV
jgi:prevent-host-death family protein